MKFTNSAVTNQVANKDNCIITLNHCLAENVDL